MYEQLKPRVASLLSRPRPMKPQTQRQLSRHLEEHGGSLGPFLLCAAQVLEDHEIDILFAPLCTPTLDDRVEVADLLFHWRPDADDLARLVTELSAEVPHTIVLLPDGTEASLTLHEVMVERFVRLLRLDQAPEPTVSAALREALPVELWPVAVALLCERGMTPRHQAWFAGFVSHLAGRAEITRGLLQTVADFIAGQPDLEPAKVMAAASALMRATERTAAYAAGGHAYWSPDVAQHHHYRGQGQVDKARVEQHQAEVERVSVLVEALTTFDPGGVESL